MHTDLLHQAGQDQVTYLMLSCHFRDEAFLLLISVLYLLNQT